MVLGVRGVLSKESPDVGVSPTCFDPKETKADIQMALVLNEDNNNRKN